MTSRIIKYSIRNEGLSLRALYKFRSIRSKILLGFSLVIVLVILLGFYNFLNTRDINASTEEMIAEHLELLNRIEKVTYNTSAQLSEVRGALLSDDNANKENFNKLTEESENHFKVIFELDDSAETRKLYDETIEWREIVESEVFAIDEQGDEGVALKNLQEQVLPISITLISQYEDLADDTGEAIVELGEENINHGEASLVVGVAVAIVIVLLSAGIAIYTSASITRPIIRVMDRMKIIAQGDLSHEPLQTAARDETGQLIHAMNDMNENIRSLLNRVSNVSESVTTQSEELTQSSNEVTSASEQIALTMQELATGSETQANTATDLSSAMATFSSRVEAANEDGEAIQDASNEVLNMTNEGAELMATSTEQMTKINEIVHDAVGKVEGLDAHSQEISQLVAVIQEIADQTNLLSLNAAIEAARAGEHGKGFAIVADEVRKLAEESSESVTNITNIVNRIQQESSAVSTSLRDSYQEVEQGTEQIITTGETFKNISAAVTQVGERIDGIAEHLNDISQQTERMGGAVEDVAAVSEEAAAGVEETSASTEQTNASMEEVAASSADLAQLAEELNELVNQFKV